MTGLDEIRPLRPYVEIFREPGAWQFSVAGLIGRMPMSMTGLGTVLLISAVTGRYGIAGAVSAVGSLGYALSAPRVAAWADRLGQRRVLLPLLTVFGCATAALVLIVELGAPTWAYFLPGALSGAAMPSLGAMVRARWSVLLSGTSRLHTAFSYESVADEMCFIIGPAAVTVLATEVYPAAGLGVAALLCTAGTIWFVAQRRTEPAAAGPPQLAGRGAAAPALLVLVPGNVFLGAMFVSIELATVSFAQQHGHKPLAGFILGVYALGSATGGLIYGARGWRLPLGARYVLFLSLSVLGVATFWAMPDLLALTCVIYLCGMTIAPTLITGFSVLEAQAAPERKTEAMSWLSSGIGVGVAAGSSVVGFIIDAHGARWGYVFAAACGALSAASAWLFRSRLRVPGGGLEVVQRAAG